MDARSYARDKRLTIIAVALPEVVVACTTRAHYRARCVLLEESKRAAPLQPGDVVLVRRMTSGLALVERVTAGRPDGCWYVLLAFCLSPNRVTTLFTSVGNEADRVGPT
jgi:hypothetical protein